MLKKNILFGVGITNATKKEILEYIITGLQKKEEKYFVVTPNPEFIVHANKNKEFKNVLNNAKIALCDGVGLLIAAQLLGKPLKERVTGTDLMDELCRESLKKPITVGFLGGRGKIAESTAKCLIAKYPGLKVTFAASEWPHDNSKIESRIKNQESRQRTKKKNHDSLFMIHNTVDILFVAFGFPKQEEWIAKNLPNIPVKVAMGVGGAFDYISGEVPRAPQFIRSFGFEWLYRLILQPWRIKRQLALLEFILLVLKEKFK